MILGFNFLILKRLEVYGVRLYNYCMPTLLSKLGVIASFTACGIGCTSGKSMVKALTTRCSLVWLAFLIGWGSLLFSAFTGSIGVDNCSICYLRLRLRRIGPPSDGVEILFTVVSCLGGYTASLKSAFTSEVCCCRGTGTLTLLLDLFNEERRWVFP